MTSESLNDVSTTKRDLFILCYLDTDHCSTYFSVKNLQICPSIWEPKTHLPQEHYIHMLTAKPNIPRSTILESHLLEMDNRANLGELSGAN